MDELPEAYKEGWIPFLGLTIRLDSRPLIPRPETEWWTEQLITELGGTTSKWSGRARALAGEGDPRTFVRGSGEFRGLDLCSGSGAIGCALMKAFPDAKVSFGEINPAHEATIRENIRINDLDAAKADVRIGDLFAPFAGQTFDVIASNPPYIPAERALPSSVADFEPALALRAGADGLSLIRRIAERLGSYLVPGGEAWIECDIENIEAARALFVKKGFSATILDDQYARPRVLMVRYTDSACATSFSTSRLK